MYSLYLCLHVHTVIVCVCVCVCVLVCLHICVHSGTAKLYYTVAFKVLCTTPLKIEINLFCQWIIWSRYEKCEVCRFKNARFVYHQKTFKLKQNFRLKIYKKILMLFSFTKSRKFTWWWLLNPNQSKMKCSVISGFSAKNWFMVRDTYIAVSRD